MQQESVFVLLCRLLAFCTVMHNLPDRFNTLKASLFFAFIKGVLALSHDSSVVSYRSFPPPQCKHLRLLSTARQSVVNPAATTCHPEASFNHIPAVVRGEVITWINRFVSFPQLSCALSFKVTSSGILCVFFARPNPIRLRRSRGDKKKKESSIVNPPSSAQNTPPSPSHLHYVEIIW